MFITILFAGIIGAIIGFIFGYLVKQEASYQDGLSDGNREGYMRSVADRANAILRKQKEESQ